MAGHSILDSTKPKVAFSEDARACLAADARKNGCLSSVGQGPGHQTARVFRAALDCLPFGLLTVDASSCVLTLNRAAATMMKAADGLILRYGRLTSARPDEARHLKAHIARAARRWTRPDLAGRSD